MLYSKHYRIIGNHYLVSLEKSKTSAIAQLKAGKSVDTVASSLELSSALVQEWLDELPEDGRVSRELGSMSIQAAVEILDDVDTEYSTNSDKLKRSLVSLALHLCNEFKVGLHDPEIAMGLNKSADTLAKLQAAFFPKSSTTVDVDITNNTTNQSLSVFKESLRH